MKSRVCARSLAAGGALLAHAVMAQPVDQQPVPPAPPTQAATTRIEAFATTQRLTGGFGPWHDFGVRGTHATGAHVFQGELASTRRFGESGAFASVGDVYTFNPDWYAQATVGAGDGASYLPRVRFDAFLNRKLLRKRNLVATLGYTRYIAPDGHRDRSLGLGGIFYFQVPLVVQAEVRRNISDPGEVGTTRRFVAATWGRESELQVVARHAWGQEGYQALGSGASIANFDSKESSLMVRRSFGRWGLSLQIEQYRNPTYRRNGAIVTLFRDFQ